MNLRCPGTNVHASIFARILKARQLDLLQNWRTNQHMKYTCGKIDIQNETNTLNAPRLRWSYMYRNMIRHIHNYNVDDLPYTKYVNISLNPVSTEPISPPETPRRQELCLCLCMTLQTFWRSEGRFTNLFFSSTKKSARQTCGDLTGICSPDRNNFFFSLSLSLSLSLPPSLHLHHKGSASGWRRFYHSVPYAIILDATLIAKCWRTSMQYDPTFHTSTPHTCSWNYKQSLFNLSIMLGKSVPFLPF